jgi:ornithine carbamoyltransferase
MTDNTQGAVRHFLSLLDLSATELNGLVDRAIELKRMHYAGEDFAPLRNRTLGMIFEKSSTRTRVSFEAGMTQLGGHAIFLSPRDTQLGRGEPIEDSARVLSRMVDCIMIRTFEHEKLERFAEYSRVPVINALTDMLHPCQLLADVQTYRELRGDIGGKRVAWIGDGNNMCNSYLNAARQFGFKLIIGCPEGYEPDPAILEGAKGCYEITHDPISAVEGAQLVTTDTWVSMGQEEEKSRRRKIFGSYQVTSEMMASADKEAIFLHCLPAYRGEEVAADVIDGPQSAVWQQAENRLHAQKALLELLLV